MKKSDNDVDDVPDASDMSMSMEDGVHSKDDGDEDEKAARDQMHEVALNSERASEQASENIDSIEQLDKSSSGRNRI